MRRRAPRSFNRSRKYVNNSKAARKRLQGTFRDIASKNPKRIWGRFRKVARAFSGRRIGRSSTVASGGLAPTQKFSVVHKGPKPMMKLWSSGTIQKNVLKSSGAFRVTSSVGQQGVISAAFAVHDGYPATTTGRSLRDLLFVGTSGPNQKMYVKGADVRVRASNMSNATCTLLCYICTPRETISYGDTDQDPVACWTNGLTDTGTSATINTFGQTPFIGRFGYVWKCLTVKKWHLNPGQIATLEMNIDQNWMLQNAVVAGTPTRKAVIRNRTLSTMWVVQGDACADSGNKTLVSTCPIVIDAVWDIKHQYTWVQDSAMQETLYTSADLPYGNVVNPEVMDDDSGAVAAVANA